MALNIDSLRREAAGAMWVSPARVCLTAEGGLVDCEDTRAVKLLVGEGGSLPVTEAERYGLVARPATETVAAAVSIAIEEPEEKAQEPVEDKQIAPPENKRRRRG